MIDSLLPDESHGPMIVAVQWLTVSIAGVLVLFRVYTRAFLGKIAGWDDWTILIALAFAITQSIISIFQVNNGLGRHIEYLQPHQIENVLFFNLISDVLHTIGTFFVRVSVCLFILRLVPATHRVFYNGTYAVIGIFSTITTVSFLITMVQCRPIQATTERTMKNSICISHEDLNVIPKTLGAFAVVMDVVCVALPIFVLRNRRAKLWAILAFSGLLGLGFFTAGCAIARTVLIKYGGDDFSWSQALVAAWACLEQNIGIIAASLPVLDQLPSVFKRRPSRASSISSTLFMCVRPQRVHDDDRIWLTKLPNGSMPWMASMESVNAPLSPTKKEPRMECEMKSPTGTAERSRRNTEVQIDLATPCGSMERSRRNTQAHVQLPERVHLDDFWSRAYFDDC